MSKESMSYNELCTLVKEYYKEENKLELDLKSNYALISNIISGKGMEPIYITNGGVGLTRFALSNDVVKKIIKLNYAKKNKEVDDIEFNKDSISFTAKENKEALSNIEDTNPISSVVYDSSMGYDKIKDLIIDYFEKWRKLRITFLDSGYVMSVLKDNKDNGIIHAKTVDDDEVIMDMNEVMFIIRKSFKEKGLLPLKVFFGEQVLINFVEKEFFPEEEKTEVKTQVKRETKKEPVVCELPNEEEKENSVFNNLSAEPVAITNEELEIIMKGNALVARTENDKRERAILDAKWKQVKCAVLSGVCLAGALFVVYTRRVDKDKTIKDELNAFNSWTSMTEYIDDIGPLATGLLVGAGYNAVQSRKSKKLVKKLRREKEDYMDAYNDIFKRE